MKNRVKILVALLVAIVVFSGIGFYFYQRGNSDVKEVTVEIISKRDDFNEKENYKTNIEYLGDLLKEENIVTDYEDSEYGMYIHGVKNMADDPSAQYWWSISVDGKSATQGADALVLEDGKTYTLELKQGY
ncbi:hypothetical protein B5F09_05460 [Erysipelatoclostridium sp. An173]|uniref:DUF4430 domain-containing protein n=1 Tax=unclassified Thomasclavelia TaxID=3025756 RepID=UPI000B391271|nr:MULTISPECIES: DUF4430 domain-containing protein [unclassified Thomasclavelia]OUP77690.1 hypothetical protein B5F09_05460 [Erysipelatoclostridium sp. An173]